MEVGDNGEIGVADLMLDEENPRHEPVKGQRAVIRALLDEGGEKIVKLAEDMMAHGLNPADSLLVIPSSRPRTYTVVEGNRRVAALKLLHNPELATTDKQKKTFRQLARQGRVPSEIRCSVLATRQEARHWMTLRHGGERGGVGVVPWGAVAVQRFSGRRGSQADLGVIFVDAVERAYPRDAALKANIDKVRKDKITTLGRVVQDPQVRTLLGFQFSGADLLVHYDDAAFKQIAENLLNDIANKITVTGLKTKEMRAQYARKVTTPPADEYHEHTLVLGSTKPPAKKTAKKAAKKAAAPSGPNRILEGVDLTNLGERLAALVREAKALDADASPNAATALIRVILELAVGRVHDIKNWGEPRNLREGVKKCLTALDKTGKDRKYEWVRAGLNDGTSLLSIRTLQGYLHNEHYHPSGAEARRLSAGYGEFLKGLDTLV